MKNERNNVTAAVQYDRPSCRVIKVETEGVLCSSNGVKTSGFSEKYTYETV